jgi:integrase
MPLSDTAVRMAKPRPKTYKLSDSAGLYLKVAPTGLAILALEVSVRRQGKASGARPIFRSSPWRGRGQTHWRPAAFCMPKKEREREAKLAAANSFESVVRDWHAVMRPKWTKHHARNVIESLEKDIFPVVGDRPIAELKAPELLDAIRRIEKRGAIDIAQRVRQRCSAVFAYAIGTGLSENNPVAAMKGAFLTRRKEPRRMLPAVELPSFLRNLRTHKGEKTIQLALRLIVLTMVRTAELRGPRWDEFDLEKKVWLIPEGRMKMRAPHLVPLSRRTLVAASGTVGSSTGMTTRIRSRRFAMPQIASIAMAETRLAARAVPGVLRHLAPIVAWATAAIGLGAIVGFAAVILPPLGAFGIVAMVAVLLLWVMPEAPLVYPALIRKTFYVMLVVNLCVPDYR